MARTRRRGVAESITDQSSEEEARLPLDQGQIVSAALALLDEVGLKDMTMRRLADRLAIKAASLYWYVRDKDELLELLADAISGEVRAPDPTAPWRAWLDALLWEYRRVLRAHRDAARILAGTMPAGSKRLRLIDLALGALLEAGFEGQDAVHAGRLLVDYVTACVLEEINEDEMTGAASGHAADSGAPSTDAPLPFAGVTLDAYPSIAALTLYLMVPDQEGRFRFGLKVVLDGLEHQLMRSNETTI